MRLLFRRTLAAGALAAACLLAACSTSPQAAEALSLDKGGRLLAAKDYERAVLEFKNAIQSMPKHAEAHYQLAMAYLGAGNLKAAASELVKATELDPHHIGAEMQLAELMALNKDLDVVREGQRRAQAALDLSPGNPDALHALAVAELRLADPTAAVRHLQEAIAKVPSHLKSSLTLAAFRLKQNEIAEAEGILRASVAEAPDSAPHALALAQFYMVIRRPQEAEVQFRRALKIDPSNGGALAALGDLLAAKNENVEAEKLYARASGLPDDQYRTLHARFLIASGKSEAGVKELRRLYGSDSGNRTLRTQLVAALIQLDRIADAESVLTDALNRNTKDADALEQRAEFFARTGRYGDAQRDLTEALRFRPNWPEAHLILARVHQAQGAAVVARQELNEALQIDATLLPARIELARSLIMNNAGRGAVEVLDQAPADQKALPSVMAERNAALFATRDYEQMRKNIDKGLAAFPGDSALMLQDGMLRLKTMDYAGARRALEAVLRRNPDEFRALEALAFSYAAQKDMPKATARVRQQVELLGGSAEAQYFLGTWLLRTGDRVGARAAFLSALKINPASNPAALGVADMDLAEGKLEPARVRVQSLLTRGDRSVNVLLKAAQIESAAGRDLEAQAYYERVILQDPNNLEALNNLAYSLANGGKDPDRALALSQKVKELAPYSSAIDDTIGWAYYQKGLYPIAARYIAKSSDASAIRNYHLAMTHFKLGNRERAEGFLRVAMAQDPSLAEAKTAARLIK